jgi:hypothetical protein
MFFAQIALRKEVGKIALSAFLVSSVLCF